VTEGYSLENRLARVAWAFVYMLLFRFSPRPLHGWRSCLLRLFGGRIGERCHIYGGAKIWAPWNLDCRASACIADDAEIYNPARVILEEGAIISQGAFLCAASHDSQRGNFRWSMRRSRLDAKHGSRRARLFCRGSRSVRVASSAPGAW
jgi:putative colanic acid biosynthesis acetyltransferase WcaF